LTGGGARRSAGLLMYRWRGGRLQVLLVHPGGPYFARRDDGAWSIPKGEVGEGEDDLSAATRELREELGVEPVGELIDLGEVRQRGGKTVRAWAFEGDYDDSTPPRSNLVRLEWPPRSGRFAEFPEIDRAEFFDLEVARRKLNPAQAVFCDRLAHASASRQ
jgi:predicted NUDIX family NTP pyrophosphohydrolase